MNVLPAGGAAAWVGKARCELQPPFPSCSPARFFSGDLRAQPSQPCLSPTSPPPPVGYSVCSSPTTTPAAPIPPICCLWGSGVQQAEGKEEGDRGLFLGAAG